MLRIAPKALSSSAVRVAIIRLSGGVLTLLSLLCGLNVLGPSNFGRSVVLLSIGALLALPASSMERLVLRLASRNNISDSMTIVHTFYRYSAVLILVAALTSGALFFHDLERWADPLAIGITAASWTEVTLRQAHLRATGHLMWGQVPNEVVRPAATILGFFVATMAPDILVAPTAVLIPSIVVLALIFLSPLSIRSTVAHELNVKIIEHTRPMIGFLIIAIVAAFIERVYLIIVGTAASESDASLLTVGLRFIQAGLFGQAFAIFYFSPRLAREISTDNGFSAALLTCRRIRVISLLTGTPAILLLLISPDWMVRVLGDFPGTRTVLAASALAILAQILTGPTQAALTMSNGENYVALAYVTGSAVGFITYLTSGNHGAEAAIVAIALSYWCFALAQTASALYKFRRIF